MSRRRQRSDVGAAPRAAPARPDAGHATARVATLLAGGVPFLLYLSTLAPTIYGVDGAELSTGAYLLGIVHPPGSPLFVLIGHVFTWLPVGDVGYRLNLLSACAAALGITFVYRLLLRLTGAVALSVGASWFLACTYYYWVSAVAAELYALQACFVAALLLLALRWQAENRTWQLAAFCFAFGLGTGNHTSLVLLAPGFILLLISAQGAKLSAFRLVLGGLACFFLGTSVHLYLPLRHVAELPLNPARDYWSVNLASVEGMTWMLSGEAFHRFFFSAQPFDLVGEVGRYLQRVWSNFVGMGALLAIIGLASDLRARPRLHVALLVMLAGHLAFYLPYGAGDKELMFLPTYLIVALWSALGMVAVARRISAPTAQRPLAGALLAFGLAASTAMLNHRLVNVRGDWSTRTRAERILDALPAGAVFVGSWKDARLVEYLKYVEQRRPDVQMIDFTLAPDTDRRRFVFSHARLGKPVYLSTLYGFTGLEDRFEPVDGCECYRLKTSFPLDR